MIVTDIEQEQDVSCKVSLTPWQENRYDLISWWDMKEFDLGTFYNIGFLLNHLKKYPNINTNATRIEKILSDIGAACGEIALNETVKVINECIRDFGKLNSTQIACRIDEIDRAISREMDSHLFMRIPLDRAEYYQSWGEAKREKEGKEIPLFGNAVNTNFTSATFDIVEAGNCFAVGRYTACVFHLMRVLEIGLSTLANKFNVPSNHTNWQNIIDQIEERIRSMGSDQNKPATWKEEEQFYSQVATQFIFLKNAWRNYTVHVRGGKYTDEEAENIMRSVLAFMQKLSTKLSENPKEDY